MEKVQRAVREGDLTTETPPDGWKDASSSDWRKHVIESLDEGCELIEDWDRTFYEATKVLSDAYLTLNGKRSVEPPELINEHELEDFFWGLQRSSTVIDALVGSVCVVLMRWIDLAKRVAVDNLILLETKFPFKVDPESEKAKRKRHVRSVMQDFGSKVPGKQVSGALAIWNIGNIFKHSADMLHEPTEKFAIEMGFSSPLLEVTEHEYEKELRQMALREVGYTLDADSIERMALQLGCGPTAGLIPLYDHVESWRKAIDTKLIDERKALRNLTL